VSERAFLQAPTRRAVLTATALPNVTRRVTIKTRDQELSAQGLKRLFEMGERRGVSADLATVYADSWTCLTALVLQRT
jgi:hypothetical protein